MLLRHRPPEDARRAGSMTGVTSGLPHEGGLQVRTIWRGLLAGIRTHRRFRCRASYWPPLPNSSESVRSTRRSNLITAAGQFRIRTGFPIATPANRRTNSTREISMKSVISWHADFNAPASALPFLCRHLCCSIECRVARKVAVGTAGARSSQLDRDRRFGVSAADLAGHRDDRD